LLLRRGVWVDSEILNLVLGGTPESTTVSLPLGGHIIVGDEAILLLLVLARGIQVNDERHRRRVVKRGWGFDLEIGTRKYI
jgi:hypothetical protein